MQHEALHGHPTRYQWLNDQLGYASLWLWLPYRVYREQVDRFMFKPKDSPVHPRVEAEAA